MMKDGLTYKTIHAPSWSFLEAVAQRGVQFIIEIVLARLLFTEQFFLDSEFEAALIQKCEAMQTDICSIFYFNIVAGLAAVGLLFSVAPLYYFSPEPKAPSL